MFSYPEDALIDDDTGLAVVASDAPMPHVLGLDALPGGPTQAEMREWRQCRGYRPVDGLCACRGCNPYLPETGPT